jgi:hypothetical protein
MLQQQRRVELPADDASVPSVRSRRSHGEPGAVVVRAVHAGHPHETPVVEPDDVGLCPGRKWSIDAVGFRAPMDAVVGCPQPHQRGIDVTGAECGRAPVDGHERSVSQPSDPPYDVVHLRYRDRIAPIALLQKRHMDPVRFEPMPSGACGEEEELQPSVEVEQAWLPHIAIEGDRVLQPPTASLVCTGGHQDLGVPTGEVGRSGAPGEIPATVEVEDVEVVVGSSSRPAPGDDQGGIANGR